MIRTHRALAALVWLAACDSTGNGSFELVTDADKADSAWVASTSFELGGVISSSVVAEPVGIWADLETDPDVQIRLIDAQVRFGKNDMAEIGYHLNQLADEILSMEVTATDDGLIRIDYSATIDAIAALKNGEIPTIEDVRAAGLDRVRVRLPVNPVRVYQQVSNRCASGWGGHSLAEYNYYYYFDLGNPECDLTDDDLIETEVELTEVFSIEDVYPEYDQLLNDLDGGLRGFRAALVPATGDDDKLSRFNRIARMLENELDLDGTDVFSETNPDVRIRRSYRWVSGQVAIEIDLFEPQSSFSSSFHRALGEYQLVFYNGHSGYGTKNLLSNEEAYPEDLYQIIIMWSCRSYEYYARQVFRAKMTEEDPNGWDKADMLASGESTYPHNAARTLKPVLVGLMAGMESDVDDHDGDAPTWQEITRDINAAAPGFKYGAAGTRENRWQPGD